MPSRKCPEIPKTGLKDDYVYFMPVDQLRAQVFLGHGLIYPAIYDKAGLSVDFHDSQRQTPAKLTLYGTPQPLNHDQLLLRVLLRPDEITAAERDGDVLRLAIPLPISRLAGIEVSPAIEDLNRYINGWVVPDIPVPRYLFTKAVVQSGQDQGSSYSNPQQEDVTPDLVVAESINRFDRYLGMIAFLRNAERYFSEETGYYADYPNVFFSICKQITGMSGLAPSGCPTPDPLLLAILDLETPTSTVTTSVLSLVSSQEPYIAEEKARSQAKEIYKATGKNEILGQAFKKSFEGDYQSAIQNLQTPGLPVEAAVLAGLFKFSMRQSYDHRTVKHCLHEEWSDPTQAYLVLAALGAYYGYAALDAKETTLYSVHPVIDPLIEKQPEIKFHLNTHFERELIEALYQRAFFPEKPIQNLGSLFSKIIVSQASPDPRVRGNSVRHSNCR